MKLREAIDSWVVINPNFAAWALVWARADAGSRLHRKARAFIWLHARDEYDTITAWLAAHRELAP